MKNLQYLFKPCGCYIQIVLNEQKIHENIPGLVKKSDLHHTYQLKLDNGLRTNVSVYLSLIQ